MNTRADHALRAAVAQEIEKSSLTMTEWLTLGVVAAGPKEGMRMTQIARELGVTLPQVTALVSSLLDKKFCKQRVFADDRRGRQVIATLKGRRLLARLEVSTHKAITLLCGKIENEQLQAYVDTLKQLAEPSADHRQL